MTTTISADHAPKISALNNLVSIVTKADIWISTQAEQNARREALAFIVDANLLSRTTQLIRDIGDLINKDVKKSTCEVSWKLHQEVETLLNRKINNILSSQIDEKDKYLVRAIHNLYLSCKDQNFHKYMKGEVVSFAGVPRDFVPTWYRNSIYLE